MTDQPDHDTDSLAESHDTLLREAARISKPEASWHVQVPIGSTLQGGRLRVLRCLGVGGMGVVFEALDEQRDSRVALKLLTRPSAGSVYRIKNECRALSRCAGSGAWRGETRGECCSHEATPTWPRKEFATCRH
jgi:hypothetical protein